MSKICSNENITKFINNCVRSMYVGVEFYNLVLFEVEHFMLFTVVSSIYNNSVYV